jgi:hypothetical protein
MNNGGNDCQRISRRVALSGAALALGAAAIATAVSQAAALRPAERSSPICAGLRSLPVKR